MKIKCVIFDLDGTVAKTNELILEAFNFVAEKYAGRKFKFEEIASQFFGPPEEGGIKKLLEMKYADVNDELLAKALDDFFAYYESNHHKAEVYKGIVDLIKLLRKRGIKTAIFTGKGKRTTEITLSKLGISDLFDVVITGNDVQKHKPSGEGISKIIEKFGLTPDEAILVGDAISDVMAGREAGVKVISALWDSYTVEKVISQRPDFIVYTVSELKDLLLNLADEGKIHT